MIHEGNTAGQFRRMMVGQQMGAGRELDALGAHQRLGNQDVGRGIGFPGRGEVLTYPGFGKAQTVAQGDVFQIPFKTFAQIALRRMGRHHEYSDFH